MTLRLRRFAAALLGLWLLLAPAPLFAQALGAAFDVDAAFPQAFDSNGNPLAGGSLSFFAAGTSTPQTVYSDAALTTPLSNPLTLDSAGRAPAIFLSATSYKVLLKDSGGSTIATVDNFAGATYLAQQATAPVIQTTTSTGTVNDFALTARVNILRCTNAADLALTGMTAGYSGQRVLIVALGAGNVLLAPQNAGSVAANRLINFATTGNTPLAGGSGFAEYEYDATTQRWRLLQHEQGAWLTPTFSAGNFTGNGAMTWTVAAGDVGSFRYMLRGRALTVAFELNTTTVGGTPSDRLKIGNGAWGSFSAAAGSVYAHCGWCNDNGTVREMFLQVSATSIDVRISSLANFAAATDATFAFAEITFEVQD